MNNLLLQTAEARSHLEESLALARQAEDWANVCCALRQLGLLAGYYQDAADLDKALALFQEAELIARRVNNVDWIAENISESGVILLFQGNVSAAEHRIAESLEYYRQAKEPGAESVRLLNLLARSARRRGDFAAAEAYYQEARQFIDRLGGRYARLEQLNMLTLLAYEQEDYAEAERLARKCLAAARNLGHREIIFESLNRILEICRAQEKYSEVERHALKGLEFARTWKRKDAIQDYLVELGRTAQARKDYPAAQSWFEQALAVEIPGQDRPSFVSYFAGRFYAEAGDFPKACQLFHASLKRIPAAEDSVTLSRALFQMIEPLLQHGWAESAAEITGALEGLGGIMRPKQSDLDPILAQLQAALPEDNFKAAKACGRELGLEPIRLNLMEKFLESK